MVRELNRGILRLSHRLELEPGARVLDYGCAELPYRRMLPAEVELVGADLPGNPDATVEIDGEGRVPLPDASFDAVLSTQVLEHVADPRVYLAECARLLRPGGRLLLTTHGIMVYHPDPVDYWRWTWAGLVKEVERHGLETGPVEGFMGPVPTGLQLLQDGLYHRLRRPRLKALLARGMQWAIGRAIEWDRERPLAARHNALVFGLVARKPHG